MEKIKNIIIFALVIMCGFIYTCRGTKIEKEIEVQEVTKVEQKKVIEFVHDTITRKVTNTKYISKPVYILIGKDTAYKYSTPFEDTVLKGNITSIILNNKLKSQEFIYNFKVPRTVIIRDSIFTTKTITKTILERKNKLFIGSTLYQINGTMSLSFDGLFKTKRNLMFGGGYDPFLKAGNVKLYIGLGK